MSAALPFQLEVDAGIDVRVVAAAIAFAVLSTVSFALGPAWSIARQRLTPDLKGDGSLRTRLVSGPVLVAAQIAVSLVLVAAGGLFVRGALNTASFDPGFPLDRQLVVGIDPSLAGYDKTRGHAIYRDVLERLRTLPGVEAASFASTAPFGGMSEGRKVQLTPQRSVDATFLIVGADYFRTFGLPMLRGREFTSQEEDSAAKGLPAAIVDEPLAKKLFGGDDPIGRQVQVAEHEDGPMHAVQIVGVAPGIRRDLFELTPSATLYVASGSQYREGMNLHVHVASGVSEADMLSTIRSELTRVDNRLPIVLMKTMVGQRDSSVPVWAVRTAASMFSAFGVLALLLATVGVYALKAYDVSRRTREMGIRIALGASDGDVTGLVLREGAKTAVLGLTVGVLLAMGVGKLLSGLLFKVSPLDPVVLTAAALILGGSTIAASYLPARRATRVAPMIALRTE